MHRRQAQPWSQILSRGLVCVLVFVFGAASCAPLPAPTDMAASPSPRLSPTQPPWPSPLPGNTPTLESSGTPECSPSSIETVDIPTTYLPKAVHASVYLPPCYPDRPQERYPVLYLFHGVTYTDEQWIHLGVTQTADRLIAQGEVPPFLIVLPYDPSSLEPDQYGFAQAVTQDLIPAIDARYRTLSDRLHRAVGGLSRGAGWAIHLGLTRPDLFGAIGAHSVVVFSSDDLLVAGWLAAIPPDAMPRIYLDIGDQDAGLPSARLLEAMLTAEDIPHEWHLDRGSHDEAYWSSHLEAYLRWYTQDW